MVKNKRTNLLNQDNGKEKNEFGVDLDLEQHIIQKIKEDQGKAKYRICKERPLLIPYSDDEIQFLIDETGLTKEELKKQGRVVHYLYQIQALRPINNPYKQINTGEYGGFISSHANLDYLDESWVNSSVVLFSSCRVSGNTLIEGDIFVSGVANFTQKVHLVSQNQKIIIDHNGIYNATQKEYTKVEHKLSSEDIQDLVNQNWIINEIGKNVIPFNCKAAI